MVSVIISRLVILIFGTLYPAYASYKAVKTKNVREYVKWMMYWIVFALFTSAETVADVLLSWFPFYYEIKIVFVLWLLSPATKGSSFLYRKFVHPLFMKHEKDIDDTIAKASDHGYTALLSLGSRGITYAASTIVQTAMKVQVTAAEHMKRSYSMGDLSDSSNDNLQLPNRLSLNDGAVPPAIPEDDVLDNRQIIEREQRARSRVVHSSLQREPAMEPDRVTRRSASQASSALRNQRDPSKAADDYKSATLPRRTKNRPALTEDTFTDADSATTGYNLRRRDRPNYAVDADEQAFIDDQLPLSSRQGDELEAAAEVDTSATTSFFERISFFPMSVTSYSRPTNT